MQRVSGKGGVRPPSPALARASFVRLCLYSVVLLSLLSHYFKPSLGAGIWGRVARCFERCVWRVYAALLFELGQAGQLSARPGGVRPSDSRVRSEISISQHDHSCSHLTIHIHTSSAECRSDRSCIRRSHEIGTEIAISRHDHSRSHLSIHIHTSSAECRSDRSCMRRSHEIDTEISISQHDHSRSHLTIHIHTSSAE